MTGIASNLLWVWRDQPTRFGYGSQQRAAHVLDVLSQYFRLHLVILNERGVLTEPPDEALLAKCESCLQIVTTESREFAFHQSATPSAAERHFTRVEMPRDEVAEYVARLPQEKRIEATLIFSFDVCVFLTRVLDRLQPAYHDLDELLSRRQQRFLATVGFPPGQADEARRRALLYQLTERQLLPGFRGVFVSSEVERMNLRGLVLEERVTVVPNATRWTAPLAPKSAPGPRVLLFVATINYFPNHDAVMFFLREIWPLLRQRYGDGVRFHLVGSRAPASFRPETVGGVTFDRDADELQPAYGEADLVVVPIRAGGGTRVKILEAFALGRPVVSTTLGAEGLDVEHGRHLLLADAPEAFAAACGTLLDDPVKAARLASEAARWVGVHHSAPAVQAAIARSRLVRDFHPLAR